MSDKLLSPKQAARAMGVSESSLKRWCDKGLIPTVKTAGGHRRIATSAMLQFARDRDHAIVSPESLQLPAVTRSTERGVVRSKELLLQALQAGDEERCRQIVFELYLAKHSISTICDRVITIAFRCLGDLWSCRDVAIYHERRSIQIMLRVLHDLQRMLAAPTRPLTAIGGTMAGDQYSLPTAMVELVLRANGWQATSLGNSLPVETLVQAIHDLRPRIFWLSASTIDEPGKFVEDFAQLHAATQSVGSALVIGGRALNSDLRRELRYTAFCDTLTHLESFAETIQIVSQPAP